MVSRLEHVHRRRNLRPHVALTNVGVLGATLGLNEPHQVANAIVVWHHQCSVVCSLHLCPDIPSGGSGRVRALHRFQRPI